MSIEEIPEQIRKHYLVIDQAIADDFSPKQIRLLKYYAEVEAQHYPPTKDDCYSPVTPQDVRFFLEDYDLEKLSFEEQTKLISELVGDFGSLPTSDDLHESQVPSFLAILDRYGL